MRRPSPTKLGWTALACLSLLLLVPVAMAQTYKITVQTDSASYLGAHSIRISGTVLPAPGVNTAVYIRVFDPTGVHTVMTGEAYVNGTTGAYSLSGGVTGGSSYWTPGKYTVNATWGAYGPVIFATTTFTWSPAATTTTSSTSSTTSATSSSSTSQTTTSSVTSSTSTTISYTIITPTTTTTTTTTTPTTTTTTTTTPTTTSQTSSAATGIPEFPYVLLGASLLTVLIIVSYLLVRRRTLSSG